MQHSAEVCLMPLTLVHLVFKADFAPLQLQHLRSEADLPDAQCSERAVQKVRPASWLTWESKLAIVLMGACSILEAQVTTWEEPSREGSCEAFVKSLRSLQAFSDFWRTAGRRSLCLLARAFLCVSTSVSKLETQV